MTNHMKDVAQLLGVELDQEFEVECKTGTLIAKITEDDILVLNGSEFLKLYNAAILLKNLIRGRYTVRPKQWQPKYGERYYSIGPGGVLEPGTWMNDFVDRALYKLGNCYRTVEDAEADKEKWIAFYDSTAKIPIQEVADD